MFSALLTQLLQQYPVLVWALPAATVLSIGAAVVVRQAQRRRVVLEQRTNKSITNKTASTSTARGGIDFAAIAQQSTVEQTPEEIPKSEQRTESTTTGELPKSASNDDARQVEAYKKEPMRVTESTSKTDHSEAKETVKTRETPPINPIEQRSARQSSEKATPPETPAAAVVEPTILKPKKEELSEPVPTESAEKPSQKPKTKATPLTKKETGKDLPKSAVLVQKQQTTSQAKKKKQSTAKKVTPARVKKLETKDQLKDTVSTPLVKTKEISKTHELFVEDKLFGSAQAVSTAKFASLYNPLDEQKPVSSAVHIATRQPSSSSTKLPFGSDICNSREKKVAVVVDGYAVMGSATKPVWRPSEVGLSTTLPLPMRPGQPVVISKSKPSIEEKPLPTIQKEILPKAKGDTKSSKQQKPKPKTQQPKGETKHKNTKATSKTQKPKSDPSYTAARSRLTTSKPFGAVIPAASGKFAVFHDPASSPTLMENKTSKARPSTKSIFGSESIFGSDIFQAQVNAKAPHSIVADEWHDVLWVSENQPWNTPSTVKIASQKPSSSTQNVQKAKKGGKATKSKKQSSKVAPSAGKKQQSSKSKTTRSAEHKPQPPKEAIKHTTPKKVVHPPSIHGSANAVESRKFAVLHDPAVSVSSAPAPKTARKRSVFGSNIDIATRPIQSFSSWGFDFGKTSPSTPQQVPRKSAAAPRASAKSVPSGVFSVIHDPSVPVISPTISARRETKRRPFCFGSDILGVKEETFVATKPTKRGGEPRTTHSRPTKKTNASKVTTSKAQTQKADTTSSGLKSQTNEQAPNHSNGYGAVLVKGSCKFATFDDPTSSSPSAPILSKEASASKRGPSFGSTLTSGHGNQALPPMAGLWAAEQQLWLSK